jgi:hypothetical protein
LVANARFGACLNTSQEFAISVVGFETLTGAVVVMEKSQSNDLTVAMTTHAGLVRRRDTQFGLLTVLQQTGERCSEPTCQGRATRARQDLLERMSGPAIEVIEHLGGLQSQAPSLLT